MENTLQNLNKSDATIIEPVYQFYLLTEKLKELLSKLQIQTITTQNNYCYFRLLDNRQQVEIVEQFASYVNTLSSVLSEPEVEKDAELEKKLVWRFLSYLKMTASNDLFAQLSQNDFIEIYNTHGIQIYRSFNFFRVCSYTIEEIICVPWFQLYKRDLQITKSYLELMGKLSDFEYQKKCIPVDIPEHTLVEIFSTKQFEVTIQPNFVSALLQIGSQKFSGALNVFKVKSFSTTMLPSVETSNPSRIYS